MENMEINIQWVNKNLVVESTKGFGVFSGDEMGNEKILGQWGTPPYSPRQYGKTCNMVPIWTKNTKPYIS